MGKFVDKFSLGGIIEPFTFADWAIEKFLERSADRGELTSGRWPWGAHETDLLRKFAEAGKKFWSNYKPTDPTTAPTNASVSKWLSAERAVVDRTAEVMAQILRADGVPIRQRKK